MKTTKYITSHIFKAAWLVIHSGKMPDYYFTTDEVIRNRPVIYMGWNDLSSEYTDKLTKGELLCGDPAQLAFVYRDLKEKIHEEIERANNERNQKAARS